MDIRKVKKLMEMLEASELAEIEIHEGEESVRISRHSALATPPSAQTPVVAAPPAPAAEQAAALTDAADDAEPEGNVVRAPMVGIFYEAMAPGKPVFVELGQSVKRGDVLCIIEAMKIMNQVEAESSGVVSKIMVKNGEPVEYGQPLFVIREE